MVKQYRGERVRFCKTVRMVDEPRAQHSPESVYHPERGKYLSPEEVSMMGILPQWKSCPIEKGRLIWDGSKGIDSKAEQEADLSSKEGKNFSPYELSLKAKHDTYS